MHSVFRGRHVHMRLGFICNLTEQDFAFAAEHGFPVVEFNENGEDVQRFLDREAELTRYMNKYGVTFSAIGRFGRGRISDNPTEREAEEKSAQALIDFCARHSVPTFVCGTKPVEGLSLYANCDRAIEAFGRLDEYARDRGVQLAIYNCRWGNFVHSPVAWAIVLKALPHVGLKYDPSHCFYEGSGDYLAEVRDWGHRFFHVHAKDVLAIEGRRVEDPPAGMGQIQWGPLMHLLHMHGYKGDVILEPHSKTWSGSRYYPGILIGQQALRHFVF